MMDLDILVHPLVFIYIYYRMEVKIYPGKFLRSYTTEDTGAKVIFTSTPAPRPKKTIAFDLDETLGSFSDLYTLWTRIPLESQTQESFNSLLDLYPEFLRVGILPVLQYVQTKIESEECLPIYIYTNNQCGPEWVNQIMDYFHNKTGIQFEKAINAYKIGNIRVEPGRTTNNKSFSDFIQCSMLSQVELCFVDDRPHPAMRRSKVYYIQPPPYFHPLDAREIESRFITGNPGTYYENVKQQMITNRIFYYLREFFVTNLLRGGRGKTRNKKRRIGTRRK
jgi:hypothetical protein